MGRIFLLACCLLLLPGAPGSAQGRFLQEPPRKSRGLTTVDVSGHFMQPIGGFRTNVDAAWGAGVSVRHHFARLDLLGVRGDFSFLNYGNESKRVPLSATVNRVLVDMTTSNNIVVASAGPELMLTRGPIHPYVYAFAGYSYFFTESSVGDDDDTGYFASTTNFGDGGLATGWGGGLSVPLRIRRAQISIDAGARRTINGARAYLKEGDITDLSDGSLQLNPRNTDGDFLQYHLGVSFGFSRR